MNCFVVSGKWVWGKACRSTIVLVAFCLGFSGCAPIEPPVPVAVKDGYTFVVDGPIRETNPPDLHCLGFTIADFESVFLPGVYHMEGDAVSCLVDSSRGGSWFLANRYPGVGGLVGLGMGPPLEWMKVTWGSSMVYRFPDSFGWGGALWTDTAFDYGYGVPSPPRVNGEVWAVLCVDADHCMAVSFMARDVLCPQFVPNEYGVSDPVWAAVTLLETAWRRMSATDPSLVPISVPDVNPSPYPMRTTPWTYEGYVPTREGGCTAPPADSVPAATPVGSLPPPVPSPAPTK